MAFPAEKLAEIDEELASFGKSDDELAEVAKRARALAAALAGEEGLAELLEGKDEALAAAREAAKASLPARPQARPGTETEVGRPAPSVVSDVETDPDESLAARGSATAEPTLDETGAVAEEAPSIEAEANTLDDTMAEPDTSETELGSGLIQISEEELRRAQLPPVLELDPPNTFPAEESTSVVPPTELDAAFEAPEASDIHGMSVDELFADAEPPAEAARPMEDDELDLLDDEGESIRLSDPELELESIVAKAKPSVPAPRPRTVPPPVPPSAAKLPPKLAPDVVAPEASAPPPDDSTLLMSTSDLLDEVDGSDDFELLVDDDVLEIDTSDETSPSEAPPEDPDDSERRGGLISRILGRK